MRKGSYKIGSELVKLGKAFPYGEGRALERLHGAVPYNIGAYACRTRHHGIVVDGDVPSPAGAGLVVGLFGVVLELDRRRAAKVGGLIARCGYTAAVRLPEGRRLQSGGLLGGRRCAVQIGVCHFGGSGAGVCGRIIGIILRVCRHP